MNPRVVDGIIDLLDNFLERHPLRNMTRSASGNYYPDFYLYLRFALPPAFQVWFIDWLTQVAANHEYPGYRTLSTLHAGRGLSTQYDPALYYLQRGVRQYESRTGQSLDAVQDYWFIPGPGEERQLANALRRWATRADAEPNDPTAEYARTISDMILHLSRNQDGELSD